ncbi:hypothetical protein [Paracoccus kondratievae]|uniref:hypothetical protein n=1 Tax=Paracoccus kondratievae TaxID=135740 RepID=UPI001D0D725E|nr:hypothetical protein [Paracoccus kondratievae]
MRIIIIPSIMWMLAAPVALAQGYEPPLADNPAPETTPEEAPRTLEEGLENFMRNMLNDAEPLLDQLGRDMGDTLSAVTPVLKDIGKLMDDVRNYQAPERLENGDILIRRRADAPPPPPVGDALRDMLRPAPENDPRLNPRGNDPLRAPEVPPFPELNPDSEISL